jgi:hypothetical protein
MKRVLAVIGLGALTALLGVFVVVALAGDKIVGPNGEHQVVVCKYVGTPGVDERLQTGQNPIVVDSNALEEGFTGTFPWEFADAQGRSIAIRWAANAHDGSITECPGVPPEDIEVMPTAPSFQDPTCELGAGITIPTVTGVHYSYDASKVAPGKTVTVTAEPEDGHVFAEGATPTWQHTYGNVPDNCGPPPEPAIEVTPGVTFQDPTCEVGAAVVPTTTTGLAYAIEGTVAPGEHVKVTASANDGYTIRGNNTWEHTFGLVPSNCAAPPAPADLCPNVEGVQEAVPDGYVLDAQGNCVAEEATTTETTPTAPLTPPTTTKKPVEKKAPAKAKPAPLTPPKKAVAGAQKKAAVQTEAQPKLAYTP